MSVHGGEGAPDLRGMRLLLVSGYYRPEQAGIAVYSTHSAEGLADLGAEVTVLTTMPHYPQWRVLPEYRGSRRLTERLADVQVERFRTYIPSRPGVVGRALSELIFGLHARRFRPPCDVVVSVVPGIGHGYVGSRIARRLGVPHGIIVQDLTGAAARQSGVPLGRIVAAPVRALEARLLRRAHGVAIVSRAFQPFVEEAGVPAGRIHLVPNWSHIPQPSRTRAETRAAMGWSDEAYVVLHTGNMGYKQGLENVVEAARLAESRAVPLRFVLMGEGSQRQSLQEAAAGLSTVSIAEPVPNDAYPDVLAAADVLLLNERPTVREMSLPSKLTSYLSAGRPVIGAVHPSGATAAELARTGGGLSVAPGDPEGLLEVALQLRAEPARAAELGAAGTEYARRNLGAEAGVARVAAFVSAVRGEALHGRR